MAAVVDTYRITVTIGGIDILVNSVNISHSMTSAIPSASITVGHEDYVWVSTYADSLLDFPSASIKIYINDVLQRTLTGVVTAFSGSETGTGIVNTLTVSPMSYYATFITSNFDGTGVPSYVSAPYTLMQAIIAFFNASVFPAQGITLTLTDPIYNGSYTFGYLVIAPRFAGMSCYDMLSTICNQYGLSVFLSWDGKVYLGSAVAPYVSGITLTKDQLKGADFSVDIRNSVFGLASTGGWL